MSKKENRYTKITRARLDECLAKIGWSTRGYGCNYYCIINQHGNPTNFMFTSKNKGDIIYGISYEGKFGEGHEYSNGGCCVFILKGCALYQRDQCVSIQTKAVKGCKQPAFISFYNFNKK